VTVLEDESKIMQNNVAYSLCQRQTRQTLLQIQTQLQNDLDCPQLYEPLGWEVSTVVTHYAYTNLYKCRQTSGKYIHS